MITHILYQRRKKRWQKKRWQKMQSNTEYNISRFKKC